VVRPIHSVARSDEPCSPCLHTSARLGDLFAGMSRRSYADSSWSLQHDTDHRQPYRFWAYPQVRACVAAALELVRVGVERAVLPFQRGLFADPQPLRLRWGSPLLPP